MRTVMRILNKMPLLEQFMHFFRSKSLTGLNGASTCHRVHHVVQQISTGRLAVRLLQLSGKVSENPDEITPRQHHGVS